MNIKDEIDLINAKLFALYFVRYLESPDEVQTGIRNMCKVAFDPSISDLERKIALQTIKHHLEAPCNVGVY